MENNNVRFNVGDRVVALIDNSDTYEQPRKKGQIYVVLAIRYCSRCGIQHINIAGEVFGANKKLYNCTCGMTNTSEGLWWSNSSRFALVDDLEEAEKAVKELVEEVLV